MVFRMSKTGNLFADGEAYERMMGRWSRLAGEVFLDWLDVPSGLRWLDVGCGNGAFTEILIARCAPAEVVAIDRSAGQLSYARLRAEAKKVQFGAANALSLPFADRVFDAAAMALVINFVPDPLKVVLEMVRVVRQGGWIATYVWDVPGGGLPVEPIFVAMDSLGIRPPTSSRAAISTEDNLRAVWQQAGLESIDTKVICTPVVYSDFDDFWDSNTVPIGPSGKAIHDLSPAERERLKARLREQLPTGSDGRIAYHAIANAVKGRTARSPPG